MHSAILRKMSLVISMQAGQSHPKRKHLKVRFAIPLVCEGVRDYPNMGGSVAKPRKHRTKLQPPSLTSLRVSS